MAHVKGRSVAIVKEAPVQVVEVEWTVNNLFTPIPQSSFFTVTLNAGTEDTVNFHQAPFQPGYSSVNVDVTFHKVDGAILSNWGIQLVLINNNQPLYQLQWSDLTAASPGFTYTGFNTNILDISLTSPIAFETNFRARTTFKVLTNDNDINHNPTSIGFSAVPYYDVKASTVGPAQPVIPAFNLGDPFANHKP